MRLFGPIIALMLIEIALFITIGGQIGLLASLLVIFGTAMLGVWLLRTTSARMAGNLRAAMAGMGRADFAAGDQALLILAAILLILPGFFGDFIGMLLLIAPLRAAIRRAVLRRVKVTRGFTGQAGPHTRSDSGPGVVIDADFIELENDQDNPRPPSGWTRH